MSLMRQRVRSLELLCRGSHRWRRLRSRVAQRDGKAVAMTSTFGPGMEARAAVTAWNPPRVFAAQGTDDWDNQLEGASSAWLGFFRTLGLYFTHFRGQRSELRQFVAPVAGTEAEAWEALTAALGQKGLSVGQRWTAPAGGPLGQRRGGEPQRRSI
jgi:hypothetical protein